MRGKIPDFARVVRYLDFAILTFADRIAIVAIALWTAVRENKK
ncbi:MULTISPECIES: hypothetical protein [Fischerella]|nr:MULTISPECIES: hypothetical protein [Fischerella]